MKLEKQTKYCIRNKHNKKFLQFDRGGVKEVDSPIDATIFKSEDACYKTFKKRGRDEFFKKGTGVGPLEYVHLEDMEFMKIEFEITVKDKVEDFLNSCKD